MKKNNQNQKEQQLFGFSSNKIDDIQDTKLNILASQKDDIFQKQNSRKQSGETIFCSDFFGNTLDTQIDTIEEQTPDQFNYNMKDDQLNLQQQKQKTPSNLLSSFRNHQSDKSSIFQRYNSITSQQDNQITNQKLMLDLSQNYFSTRSNKSKQGENNDGNFYPDLNILKKSSSILLKNNLSLNLSNKSLVEQKENKSPVMLTSMGTVKTEKSKNNKNENRNKSGLYKLQRMLNEDKIYFDKKNIETQNPYLSLQISQNGLVRQKNPGIERQNSMLLKKANLIEQQKELSTPKNILNTDQSFSSNASIFKDFSSRSDKVNSKLSLINQSQKQNDNEQQPNQQENLNFNNKSESQQKNQSEQNENLSRLFLFYNNQAKKKKPAEPERFQKRRQNETRIYNEFEPRLKTFTKFGFKMIEKEQNDYLKPFMREFQANQPKGTMYVSDLWADTNILKFLGNCRMIRDKLVLVKLAQKYQSRENLLKQINNSN